LDLPFASYSATGSFEADDRGATQQAGQIVMGQVEPESGIIVRAAAVKIKYQATVYFARRDDINVASQLVYWQSQPQGPQYVIIQYRIAGWPIDIPVFITIDSFDSNPEYNQKDWLTASKIFPLKIEMTIRTYQTLIERDGGMLLPLRFSGLYGYNENQDIYFCANTILDFVDQKWTPDKIVIPKREISYVGDGPL
jgi:hypothetical protein